MMSAHPALASLRYHDRQFDAPAVKLLPAEYFIASGDTLLSTVLGSCVSACLHDAAAGIGGMNHFLLPGAGKDLRHGKPAMDHLIEQLLAAGARRERLVAKVFGGGAVLSGMTRLNVGQRNASFVLDYLERLSISVAAQDLGGRLPRRVCFFPGSGRVAVRKLQQEEEVLQVRHQEERLIVQAAPRA